jgi:hypothetical protein
VLRFLPLFKIKRRRDHPFDSAIIDYQSIPSKQ